LHSKDEGDQHHHHDAFAGILFGHDCGSGAAI
jgi:hypothetical protein